MLRFSRLKAWLVIAACLAGVVLGLPSLLPPGFLPAGLPHPRLNLGLDLQGGSYLLLQADVQPLVHARVVEAREAAADALAKAGIRYDEMVAAGQELRFRLRDPGQAGAARRAIAPLVGVEQGASAGSGGFMLDVENGRFRLSLPAGAVAEITAKAVEQSLEIVRRRLDATGVAEPVIARQGADRILVELPGVADPGHIKRLMGSTAKLTFHLLASGGTGDGRGVAPPGTEWLPMADAGHGPSRVLVQKRVEVDGASLTSAAAAADQQTGAWVVSFALDRTGARRFADITTRNVGRPFAIVLDGKVISAPVIREPITAGRGQISGSFDAQGASDLALLLRAGALPAPLHVVEERTIGASLGADAVSAGLKSVVAGFVLVVAYMALTYGRFGLYANVALVANLFLTLAALSLLGATLSLPGIAGILLALGMAVDANILVNERVREERRRGASVVAAVETGFRRAYATIVDANATTLIKMALLFLIGTGAIRGFAVTISFGIVASMFTAIVLVRLLIARWLRRHRPKDLQVGTRARLLPDGTRIPFMRARIAGLVLSAAISAGSLGLLAAPGLNLGVDFAGGTVMEVRTPTAADLGGLRDAVARAGFGPVQIQQFGSPRDVLLRLDDRAHAEAKGTEAIDRLRDVLAAAVPGIEVLRVDAVGAAVSQELFKDGALALLLASAVMFLYITFRFEWPFAVGAIATMFLDLTKTLGFFAITGLEFNLTSIAAILTIMGFSINDKVVVYDRVRENLRLYRRMPLRELIDRSVNETLSRTVGTSIALLLSIAPLVLFGGGVLREFGIVLLFGLLLATSSSIFIAAPILLHLGERRLRRAPEPEVPAATPAETPGPAALPAP